MLCRDAPAETIVNSAIGASSDKVRAARSVFKIIFPLHFQTLGTCKVVCQKDRPRTTPCYKTHAAAGSFNMVVLARAGSASISRLNSPWLPPFQNTARFSVLALVSTDNSGYGS